MIAADTFGSKTMTHPPPHQLDYQLPAPATRAQECLAFLYRHRRLLSYTTFSLFGTAVVAWTCLKIWPWLWYGSPAYWDHAARNYSPAPGTIMYEEYEPAAWDLLKQALINPLAWQRAGRVSVGSFAARMPDVWSKIEEYRPYWTNVVFLHERQAPGRPPHLVVTSFPNNTDDRIELMSRFFDARRKAQ
jgi:hypothetical protein